jgi:hypothetical protein
LIFLGVPVGSINTYNFQGSISTSCPNDTIVDFISSSPLFTNRSALYRVSNYTWAVNIRWTANSNQTGESILVDVKILVLFFY